MYRDDHDAALARVTALSDELDRESAANTKREARIGELTSALDQANVELARAQRELTRLHPPASLPSAAPSPTPSQPAPWKWVLLAVGGVLLIAAVANVRRTKRPTAPVKSRTHALPDEVSALLPDARARGNQVLEDGRLISLAAHGVDEHGALHRRYGGVDFEFERDNAPPPMSPSDPELPIGAPHAPAPPWERNSCTTITRQGDGTWGGSASVGYCVASSADQPAFAPACTMRVLWQWALADGAQPGALANVSWGPPSMNDLIILVGRADDRTSYRWHFEIDDPRAPFEHSYADDCDPVPAANPQGQ
jgi:hypothetical protein